MSCVTAAVLIRVPPTGSGASAGLAGNPVPLRGPLGLTLELTQEYDASRDATGDRQVATTAYWYEIRDAADRELLAFHWHPFGASPVTTPHLHAGGSVGPTDLRKRHIPTAGPVPLQAVLRCLITEFGVEPLRADWQGILAEP